MEKATEYIKNVSLGIIGFLALFVGVGAVVVIFEAATWSQLGDWTLKAVLVAAVIFVINVVGSLIASSIRKN